MLLTPSVVRLSLTRDENGDGDGTYLVPTEKKLTKLGTNLGILRRAQFNQNFYISTPPSEAQIQGDSSPSRYFSPSLSES